MIGIKIITINNPFHLSLLSVFFLLRYWTFHVNRIIQSVITSGCLVSLSIMFSKSLHTVLFSLFHCTGVYHFIYLLVFDGHLHFLILPVKTYAPGTENDRLLMALCLTDAWAVRHFPRWPYHFLCPHSMYEGLVLFSTSVLSPLSVLVSTAVLCTHTVALCYYPANRFMLLLEKFQVHRKSLQKQSSCRSFSANLLHTFTYY